MKTRMVVLGCVALLMAPMAIADTKVVKQTSRDKILMAAQGRQPEQNTIILYFDEDRLRRDSGDQSIIVRLDDKVMHILDHENKTVSTLDIPIDLDAILPDTVTQEVTKIGVFTVRVTPTDEVRKIGSWKARRFDVLMTTPMIRIDSKVWATTEPGAQLDLENFTDLYQQIILLQPGMKNAAKELRKIEGFEVARESIIILSAIAGNTRTSSERVISIAEVKAPEGAYEVPEDYVVIPFEYSMITGEN